MATKRESKPTARSVAAETKRVTAEAEAEKKRIAAEDTLANRALAGESAAIPVAVPVTEFVLVRRIRRGEPQGVFSHSTELAVRAVHAQKVADDTANGRVCDYALLEKTVAGKDVTTKEIEL